MAGPNITGPQPNLDVTPDPSNQFNRYDGYLAVDPADSNHRVGICRRFAVPNGAATYQDVLEAQFTFNGGATWNTVALPLDTHTYYSISDPWIGIAPNGNVYVIALAVTNGAEDLSAAVCCYTSTDGGQTWGNPVFITAIAGLDNTFGAVDPQTGMVYAIWNDGGGYLGFAYSPDGNAWYASPMAQPQNTNYALPIQGFSFVNLSVAPDDGSIHIIGFGTDAPAILSYARSFDHGQSFEFGVIAVNQAGLSDIQGLFTINSTALNPPSLAVVNPPAICAAGNGLLFAAWSVDTGLTAANPGPIMRICLASCSDGGDWWTTLTGANAPAMVPFLPLGNLSQTPQDQYFRPRLAALPNGTVGCLFSSCQLANPAELATTTLSVGLSASVATSSDPYFIPNSTTTVMVTDRATNPLPTTPTHRWSIPNAFFISDFLGLGAEASGFIPYWSDTRNGSAQLFISQIGVPAEPFLSGWTGSPLSPPAGVKFVAGTLAVITNQNNCLEVFAVNATDGNIWHAYQQQPGGGWNWPGDGQAWHPLPPQFPVDPATGNDASFIPNPSPYGPMQSPVVVLRSGALEIFAVSSAGTPFRAAQGEIGEWGGWAPWTAMKPPPGNIWSITALTTGADAVVVYATDQGVFFDLGAPEFGAEFWLGPQPGPTKVGVNIVRANPFDFSIIGMALGNPETFYCSEFIGGAWTPWQPGPANPGPGNATLQDFRIGTLVDTGLEIFGVTRFTGQLIQSINGINGVWSWTNFQTPANGPFQYGVLDLGALPEVQGPQHGEFEAFMFQYNCLFLTNNDGTNLQLVPVLGSNGNLTANPFGPFTIDPNADGHFGAISDLAVGVNQDTRLEVFALESFHQVYHWWQTLPDPQLQSLGLPPLD